MIPVFDGHNDFLLRLYNNPGQRQAIWQGKGGGWHLDLPRMKAGGFVGGFFAVFVPSPPNQGVADLDKVMQKPPYAAPLPAPITHEEAVAATMAMVGHLYWLERTGDLSICRTAGEIRTAIAAGRIAAVLHLEGAEAIDPGLDALHVWHAAGLRSLGPVWSRPTAFGHGVPFAFPSSPDTGPGLTEAGKALVAACDKLRIMVDLSHLNEKGFDDVARISSQPLVATHCNAHAITLSSRNLTDRQLRMIGESGGMVGLNFGTFFLREDGTANADTRWDPVLRHLDHMLALVGENHLALGSDFDGALVPRGIGDVAGLPHLLQAMLDHGYGETLVMKIAGENWISLFGRLQGS